MGVSQNQWYHFGIGAPPILAYLSGIGMFTGGTMPYWRSPQYPPPPPVSPQHLRSTRTLLKNRAAAKVQRQADAANPEGTQQKPKLQRAGRLVRLPHPKKPPIDFGGQVLRPEHFSGVSNGGSGASIGSRSQERPGQKKRKHLF